MLTPKYSVVIPTYNHLDKFLKPCLESIIKYTDFNNTEVIVVANGCVDNTAQYVTELSNVYPSIKLIDVKEGLGYTKATNSGIKAATGEYVVLLNNDTVLLYQHYKNQWLEVLEAPFVSEPRMGITGPLWSYDKITKSRFIIFFCAMIPMKLFNELGLLDEVFSPGSGEDIDFCVKAVSKGYKIQVVPPDTNLEKIKDDAKMISGSFPIYHYAEGTFENINDYSSVIFKRNSLINLKRHSKEIKLHLTSKDDRNLLNEHIRVHHTALSSDVLCEWSKLDFETSTVNEIAVLDSMQDIPLTLLPNYTSEWFRVLKEAGKVVVFVPILNAAYTAQTLISSGFKIDGTQKINDYSMLIQASKL
jgi:glycosyltransferase involved in cell wall biosynthesis